MEIGIETNKGQIEGFKIDGEIIDGLYSTINIEKVNSNCEIFEIQMEAPKEGVIAHKFSKMDNLCILTMKIDDKNIIQYLIGNDMSLPELNSIPENEMPSDLRNNIIEAHSLAKLKFK